jgi:hypothetical protein
MNTARDHIDKPSIAYWRDHSAGASRRRVTPIPQGNRPSTAACTSLGARKASEIVILTCRMLHFSRVAICSSLMTVPATISSSQRRPRAIAATSVARVSARIGRGSCGEAEAGTMISRRRFIGVFFHGMRTTGPELVAQLLAISQSGTTQDRHRNPCLDPPRVFHGVAPSLLYLLQSHHKKPTEKPSR